MSEPTPADNGEQGATQHMRNRSTWLRGLFMLIFAVIYNIAEIVMAAVAVFQFFATLFTGAPNQRLASFGETLSRYFYHVVRYLTFASDDRPFPFRDWPGRPEAPKGEGGVQDQGRGETP